MTIFNANTPQYWEDIKARALVRKTDKLVEAGLKSRPSASIYEQYVWNLLETILDAAQKTGLSASQTLMDAFLLDWSKRLREPTLVGDPSEIAAHSHIAVLDVKREFDGWEE